MIALNRNHCPYAMLVLLAVMTGCKSPYYADKGAALGGLAGGLTGAVIGDHNGNAPAGALIGGAVGALTGAVVGDSMDAEVERREALIEARTGQRMARSVSMADVISMKASGLSDDVVVNHIRANGVATQLTPGEIIELHENGVSEKVINAMQQEGARRDPPAAVVSSTPVIIEESYVVPPYWGPRHYRYHCGPPYHYRHRPGVSWGFSFSH